MSSAAALDCAPADHAKTRTEQSSQRPVSSASHFMADHTAGHAADDSTRRAIGLAAIGPPVAPNESLVTAIIRVGMIPMTGHSQLWNQCRAWYQSKESAEQKFCFHKKFKSSLL